MPVTPYQLFVASLQLLMLLAGAWGMLRILAVSKTRAQVFGRNRLRHWALSGYEVGGLLLLFVMFMIVGQLTAVAIFRDLIESSPEKTGLQVALYGLGFHGGALLAWPVFHLLRRSLHQDYGAQPPEMPGPRTRLRLSGVVSHGVVTLVLVLPVLALASAAWTRLLRAGGLPDAPQDLIAIFGGVQAPWVLVMMLLVACVLAPFSEELIFRGTIYRYCRQRFGRGLALVVSSVAFGALHMNWAGFLPLALLGAGLAIAYERTGDLRVPVLAHALFNLNTIFVVLSGVVPS